MHPSESSATTKENNEESAIFQPISLPCGRVVQNRLVKVAMYEHLATLLGGAPNAHHIHLYSEWAKHDWGIVITGNVQISAEHLTLGRDLVLPKSSSDVDIQSFRELADSIHGLRNVVGRTVPVPNRTLAIMQLNHAGRQSSNFIGGRRLFQAPLAPSAIPLGTSGNPSFATRMLHSLLFQTPNEMTESDIEEVVEGFTRGAVVAQKAGFDGVQLHAAHGYLLSQFLSKKANIRTDKYSADLAIKFVHRIVKQIRESTESNFVVSIKLNAADYINRESSQADSLTEAEQVALQHLITIADWGLVDIVEISGGDYEKPDFMSSADHSKPARQAFFARFSQQALKTLHSRGNSVPLILLTGGLKTPGLLQSALACKHADLLGIGRGSVVCPELPSVLREHLQSSHRWDHIPFNPEPRLQMPWIILYPPFSWVWNVVNQIKLIGAGVTLAWYVVTMRQLAHCGASGAKFKPYYHTGGLQSIFRMWVWRVDGMKTILYRILPILVVFVLAASLYR
ncbi:NADH-dependent flavin oxidoreductase iccG [Psilocybe cubensis]|uniref:NADH-dependent flavin oxidoreductase iccG n=2 Tax=Psilocybe cubensis TaxID=181762 RepID=A0ACB8H423_PSICU|nr:NADH-dependent flavin oxidoreductase iccG [Psilocybe cubensis]KAH9482397.1 NADH-dependent flavin oxidoreductase iccG [Psilocybe cubensis]